ncbi:hypothetical protein HUJ04_003362 [Dendroctonus ponderosae]|nr:hypothetical protein HUJ04_003362 [Dendroctonus ponderosae]
MQCIIGVLHNLHLFRSPQSLREICRRKLACVPQEVPQLLQGNIEEVGADVVARSGANVIWTVREGPCLAPRVKI